MAGRKLSDLTTTESLSNDDLVYVVDISAAAGSKSKGITKANLAAQMSTSVASTEPVENEYADITALLADQGNQTTSFLQYVVDASDDPNIASGEAYYEKLATSTTTLADDYRLLSDTEVTVVKDSNSYRVFRIEAIQDEGTPLTSVSGGKVSFEYSGANVTAILFNKKYTDAIAEFYGKDVNIRFYNRAANKYETEAVASGAWTTVNTNYYRAAVTGTNIQIADLTVNDRVEFFIVEAAASGDALEYQTAITTNTTLDGSQKGLNKVYPVNSSSAVQITITTGDYVENDVINIERRGQGSVEIVADTGVRIRGVRDINNQYFINDVNSIVALLCRGSEEFGIIGNLKRGYTGQITTSSYSNLAPSETTNVSVTGTGFSSNMLDPIITGNATLNSWVYNSATSITLNITSSGSESDTLTITYDNGDVFVDTDAITLTTPPSTVIVLETTSTSATWSPSLIDNTGGSTLQWEVTGDASGSYSADDPTIDLSGNLGTAIITVSSADDLVNLVTFNVNGLSITSADLSGGVSLDYVRLDSNSLTTFSADGLVLLDRLLLNSNTSLTTIDVSGATLLRDLECVSCSSLTAIDISSNANIEELSAQVSGLTTLTVGPSNTLLTTLTINNTSLSGTLDLTDLTALVTLTAQICSLVTVDLTGLTNLVTVNLRANDLTTLDVSTNTALQNLQVDANELTVSEVNQIIIDMDRGITTGTRLLDYQLQVPAANPTRTQTITDDVLDAYNNLIADGYTVDGNVPA